MTFESPIFIVGAGRSGSSIFYEMFCEHPRAAWMSTLCDKYPDKPDRNRQLMGWIDAPVIGPLLKRKYYPAECYQFWNRLYRGFARPCRDLVAADVTEAARASIAQALPTLVTKRRSRLLAKITGWPRVGFLSAIFPDARFVHVYRDGRAVANSLMQVDFWSGWEGPWVWRRGALSLAYQKEWEQQGQSFVALAGIEWKIVMDAMEAAKERLPSRSLLEVRYEDFAADPVGSLKNITQFCGLDWSEGFEHSLRRYSVSTTNGKWKQDLTAAQQAVLQDILGDALVRYGYR